MFNIAYRPATMRKSIPQMSVVALLEIAVTAKHLAVIGGRRAALAPGHDMIGMHFRKLKMLPAIRTDSTLPFIGRTLHKHSLAGTCGIPVEGRRIYVDVDAKGAVGPNHGPADPWVIHWADGRSWTEESIYARREYGRAIFGNLCVEIDVCIAKQRKTVWWENGRWFVAKGSGMAATAI